MTPQPHDLATLIIALEHEEGPKQMDAMKELLAIGGPAVPALVQALEGGSGYLKTLAANALGRIGKPAGSAVPALLRVLKQENNPARPGIEGLQAQAADALGKIGDPAALPALVGALQDKNFLCVSAALALEKLGDPAAVAPLVGVLMDRDKFWVPRGAAAVSLGRLGRSAESAIPALTAALDFDPVNSGETWDERARDAVADALCLIRDPSLPSSLTGKGFRFEMWGIF